MSKRNKYEEFSKEAQARVKEDLRQVHLRKSCLTKKAFLNRENADKTGNDSYFCPYCRMWHTTATIKTFAARLRQIVEAKKRRLRKK